MTSISLIKNNLLRKFACGLVLCLFVFSCDHQPEHDEVLIINIPKKSMQRLAGYADKALKQNLITNDLKQFVKASIVIDGNTTPVKLRLKGDWTDHLETDYWSFRIKILNDNFYRGFKVFSIMRPETRGHVNEWFMHEILRGEGVLTTRYDFIHVIINGKKMGVYAIEEHFTQELLLANDRKVGPILKIAEDGYWEVTNKQKGDSLAYGYCLPIYDACVIEPFQKNSTIESPVLMEQFYRGQKLLFKHKIAAEPVDSLLVLDQYAKFYALGDLGKVLHGFETHNQRWYYNSEANRLEPIAYDMTVRGIFSDDERPPMFGFKSLDAEDINDKRHIIPFSLFNSSALNQKYYQYLIRFSKRTYLDSIFRVLDMDIKEREKLVQENDSTYAFNRDFYYHNSERMLAELERFEDVKSRTPPLYKLGPYMVKDSILDIQPFTYVSLNPYYDKRDSTLALENYYFSPIQIVGYVDSEDNRHKCDTIYLDRFQDDQSITWSSGFVDPTQIIFTTKRWDKLYYAEVIQWQHPSMAIKPNSIQ